MLYTRKVKYVNFHKSYFPLAYNTEIGTEPSAGDPTRTWLVFLFLFNHVLFC